MSIAANVSHRALSLTTTSSRYRFGRSSSSFRLQEPVAPASVVPPRDDASKVSKVSHSPPIPGRFGVRKGGPPASTSTISGRVTYRVCPRGASSLTSPSLYATIADNLASVACTAYPSRCLCAGSRWMTASSATILALMPSQRDARTRVWVGMNASWNDRLSNPPTSAPTGTAVRTTPR